MNKLCDACGAPFKSVVPGHSVNLCKECHPKIMTDVRKLRDAGKPINFLHIARKHFKEHHAGRPYLLRDVPKTLEKEWKKRAVDDDCTQRAVILTALREYLNR